MSSSREILLYISLLHNGNYKEMLDHIQNKEDIDEEEAKRRLSLLKCNYVTLLDPEYPEVLKQTYMAPMVLYYYGNIALLKEGTRIGIVGTRKPSKDGVEATKIIASKICDYGMTIVSGLAKGVDSIAQNEAIKRGGNVIAVLGSGIDYVYPLENLSLYKEIKEKGLIISEYPGITQPNPENFPFRNRLIAYASDRLIVTEATQKSGTSTTVFWATNANKEIYSVPAKFNSDSLCNRLIIEGSGVISCVEDLDDNFENFVK